jgi:AcrR family transcriptional regulator
MQSKKETKQDLILRIAKELFWKHGFRRVSVQEVCTKAGISKMTFYRFFSNKIELAKSVYDMVTQEGIVQFQKIMDENSSREEKMKRILLLKHEGTKQISPEFLMDFYNGKIPGLKEYAEAKKLESWQVLLSELKVAQKKGLFRKDFNPEILFLVSQKIMELFSDPQIIKLCKNPEDAIMEILNIIMYGVLPRK